jgi:hypothetical protein
MHVRAHACAGGCHRAHLVPLMRVASCRAADGALSRLNPALSPPMGVKQTADPGQKGTATSRPPSWLLLTVGAPCASGARGVRVGLVAWCMSCTVGPSCRCRPQPRSSPASRQRPALRSPAGCWACTRRPACQRRPAAACSGRRCPCPQRPRSRSLRGRMHPRNLAAPAAAGARAAGGGCACVACCVSIMRQRGTPAATTCCCQCGKRHPLHAPAAVPQRL